MTPADAIRNDTRTARLLTQVLAARVGPAVDALQLEADTIDGFKTTHSRWDTGPQGKSEDTSVEAAVLNRIEPDTDGYFDNAPMAALWEGADLAATARRVLNLLVDWCDTHSSNRLTATELDTLRCTNWRKDDPKSCGNFATPRRHNNQTIDDRRCLSCGARADELEDDRRNDSNRRRLDRHKAGAA